MPVTTVRRGDLRLSRAAALVAVTTFALLLLLAAAPPRVARAQPSPAAAGEPKPVHHLGDILGKLDWDPAERGPLLIVAPERAALKRGRVERQPDGSGVYVPAPELKEPGPEGYRLTAAVSAFQRKLTQVGSVWAVVPDTMTVLNTKDLPEPSPYLGMSRGQKLKLLQARLTDAQWKKLASPEGLGANDLDRDQRELFLSALPNPFRVQVTRTRPEGGVTTDLMTLNPAQAASARIGMRRSLSWSFQMEGDRGGMVTMGLGGEPRPDGSPHLALAHEFQDWEERRGKLLDVPLVRVEPNRLKESDVHFAAPALSAPVSLAGAKTVGDLVQRVAAAARVELHADVRYASLPVYVRAVGGVRAGDLLQAICLSVTGTFRKLEDGKGGVAYLLTDDREGLGVRHARLMQWARQVGALADEREREVLERIKEARPFEVVGWAADDPLAPTAALQQKIEAHRAEMQKPRDPSGVRPYSELFPMVSPDLLPAAAKEMVAKQIESWEKGRAAGNDDRKGLRTDAVMLDVRLRPVFLVPGVGTIEDSEMSFGGGSESLFSSDRMYNPLPSVVPAPRPGEQMPEMKLPVALPGHLRERVLWIRAASPQEAASAAREAARVGLNVLWLDVAPTVTAAEFRPIVAAAREAAPGVALYAAVRVLRQSAEGGNKYSSDLNLLGETITATGARRGKEIGKLAELNDPRRWYQTSMERLVRMARAGDFASPGDSVSAAALRRRVLEIAATPGLTGLVLRDLVPYGYQALGNMGNPTLGENEFELGYTPEMRLAFLRQTGVDPVDLTLTGDNNFWLPMTFAGSFHASLELPFFRDYGRNARGTTINDQNATELGARDAAEKWDLFRHQVGVEFQNSLFAALKQVPGPKPGQPLVLLREQVPGPFGTSGQFEPWEAPVEMPAPMKPGAGSNPALAGGGQARPRYPGMIVLDPERVKPRAKEEENMPAADRLARRVGQITESLPKPPQNSAPRGLLIDLSELPLEEGLAMLAQLRPPAPSAASAAR
jgi:hypothetical protein